MAIFGPSGSLEVLLGPKMAMIPRAKEYKYPNIWLRYGPNVIHSQTMKVYKDLQPFGPMVIRWCSP